MRFSTGYKINRFLDKGYKREVKRGGKVTINEDSIESGLGFSITPITIITKFCFIITSKLTGHKTADKSPMILAQKNSNPEIRNSRI